MNDRFYCVLLLRCCSVAIYLNVRLVAALRRGRAEWLHLQTNQRREQVGGSVPLAVEPAYYRYG